MIKLLFVCHGNICRSPMAEFYMKDLVRKNGLESRFLIESAATSDEECWNGHGNPVYPPAREELKKHGIGTPDNELGVSGKRARQMTRADYERYDLLIGMDGENRRNMLRICGGDPDGKISLLLDYTERPGSVADPWYTGDFISTWRDVRDGCDALLEYLTVNKWHQADRRRVTPQEGD